MKNKTIGKIIIIFSVIAIAASLYCLACVELEDDKIWKNASVNGISVKGMTKEEAADALDAQFVKNYSGQTLAVSYEGKTYPVNIYTALGIDTADTIDQLYSSGHGKWYFRGAQWLYCQLTGIIEKELTVHPHAESAETLEDAMKEAGFPVTDNSTESTYEITETALIIHKGQKKDVADIAKLEQEMTAAIENNDYETVIECPVTEKVPEDINFQKIYDEVHKEKKNASLDKKTLNISDSQNGVSFDAEDAAKQYASCEYGADMRIDLKIEKPEVSTEDLKNNLFTSTLASYSTQGGGSQGRITNISLAVKSCNGVILLPGETFSYNDTLGERTKERGYKAANAYSNGEVVEQLGGGICQVSSTLFSALLYTDLEIVSRSNHSMPVSYLPMGMDAAVSWGAPDLKFKNNFDYPIKLSASYSGGEISFKILGASADKKDIDVKVEKTGEMSAKTYRKYYENGKLVSTKLICNSNYKPLSSN